MPTPALQQAMDLAREGHYGLYLTALYRPAAVRVRAFVGLALHQELASIRDKVREPALQDIRFQWWAEACREAIDGHPRAHPLLQVIYSAELSGDDAVRLLGLVSARRPENTDTPFDLQSAIEETAAPYEALFHYLGFGDLAAHDRAVTDSAVALAGHRLWYALYPEYAADTAATRVREDIGQKLNTLRDQVNDQNVRVWRSLQKLPRPLRMIFLVLAELSHKPPKLPHDGPITPPAFSDFAWHRKALWCSLTGRLI